MEIITQFLDWVLSVLPTSPFARYIDALATVPYLGNLNWFVPVGTMLKIGSAWLVSIGLFYVYMIILRWIKAIE